MISKFLTINDKEPLINPSVKDALKDFKTGGDYNVLIEQIRATTDKEKQSALKKKLPGYTFGGTFKQRRVEGLEKLSGYVQLEYDNVDDVDALKDALKLDKYTTAAGVSVSGKGIWLLVRVDNITTPQDYKEAFHQLCNHYSNYGELDTKISDVSRVRYLSKDESLYINEYSTVYFFVQDASKDETSFTKKASTGTIVNNLSWWADFMTNGKYNNIVDTRHDWLRLGMAMKLSGLSFDDFNTISSLSRSYKGVEDCKKVWREEPKNVTTGTLLYFALHKAGYRITKNHVVEDTSNEKYLRMEQAVLSYYEFVLNTIHDCIEYRTAGSNDDWNRLSDWVLEELAYILNSRHNIKASSDNVRSFISGHITYNKLSYNPIVDELDKVKEFNDYDVFAKIATCFGNEGNDNTIMYLRKWFCASVMNIKRGLRDKSNELCLILKGKQGSGKNTFVEHISAIWESQYTLTHFGPVDNKDFLEKLHKGVIIYMDELSALSKTTGIEEVKSVLSMNTVSYRKSYGREISEYKVYANFIGSTNESHFLADQTGNRRFLVIDIPIERIDTDCLPTAEEIWGYAKYLINNSLETGFFNGEEMLLVQNDNESHTMVRDHLQALEEIIDIENGVVIYSKAIYIRDYLNELGGTKTNNITSNRLLKDLRSKYNIDQNVKYINGKSERVIEFPIDKEHHTSFMNFVKEKYNKDITHTITNPTIDTQLPF